MGARAVQGESGGLGLGYVDINSISFGGYPEMELSQHNPVRDHQTHPVQYVLVKLQKSYFRKDIVIWFYIIRLSNPLS